MDGASNWQITVATGGQITLARFALDPQRVFDDPRINVWRDLPERQNAYLERPAGTDEPAPARVHVKRYKSPHGPEAAAEARAIGLLHEHGIPTVPLVAWGTCTDGRGFLVSSDLTGMIPADRAVREGLPAAAALPRVASLAAKLHRSGLHHRDLYLCHFFLDPASDAQREIRLIDPGRVAHLPGFPLNLRWIVKDLAQFCYSLREVGIGRELEQELLDRYFAEAAVPCRGLIRRLIPLKVASIARHDRNLRAKQPGRRVSIPR